MISTGSPGSMSTDLLGKNTIGPASWLYQAVGTYRLIFPVAMAPAIKFIST